MNRQSKLYSHLYGWTEQNEAAYGVQRIAFDLCPGEDLVTVEQDGSLSGSCLPKGTWFLTFGEAKRAALKLWTRERDVARRALESIRRAKDAI